MTLKVGTWAVNVDGAIGLLNIGAIDAANEVGGAITIAEVTTPLIGLWDETSKHLTFIARIAGVTGESGTEYYDAYLITTPHDAQPGNDLVFTLVGTVQSVSRGGLNLRGTNVRRSRFGWFATIGEVA